MRLKNWLLAGTGLGMLAATATPTFAQADIMGAYQAYIAAQQSGDPAALASAEATLAELCASLSFNVADCVAQIEAGTFGPIPPPSRTGTPAPADPAAVAPAPVEPAPVEPAPVEPAPVEPSAEPAPVEPAPVEPAPAEPAPETAPSERTATEPAPVEAPPAEPAPVEPPPAEPAPAEPVVEQPAAPDPAVELQNNLNAQLQSYQQALDLAAAGDYANAQPLADAAQANILQLCQSAGYDSIESCIGQSLPPLPQPPAPEAPAAEPAPVPEVPAEPPPAEPAPVEPAPAEPAPAEPAPVEPAPVEPAPTEPVAGEPTPPSSRTGTPPAEPAPAEPAPADPMVQLQSDITAQVDAFNAGAAAATAGDVNGRGSAEAAYSRLLELCAQIGYGSPEECVAAFGLALAALPAPTDQPATVSEPVAEPTPPPAAEPVPEALLEQQVDLNAVEPLPADVAPSEAAPLLDSLKAIEGIFNPDAQRTADPVPTEPPPPPPTTDAEAQTQLRTASPPPPVAEEAGVRLDQLLDLNFTQPNVESTPQENGTGFTLQFNTGLFFENPEQERDRLWDESEDEIFYEELSNGRTRETIVRADGVQIVTVRDRFGDIVRRSRITPDGREYLLAYVDESEEEENEEFVEWTDPGEELPPLRLTISARDYILDAEEADEKEVADFFAQPPVEQVRRIYSIEDVKRSARIRDSVRRLEVGGLTFDSGKATISRNQVSALSNVANAMLDLLERNPAETFLIEGHTDAVGSETANLGLSDLRASTIARILTDFYDIPPENLVTQGYGERFLKVRTEASERLNRRVTIRRITPLITLASN